MNTFFSQIETALRAYGLDAPIAREKIQDDVCTETVETKVGTWIDDDRVNRLDAMLDWARTKHKLDKRNAAYLIGTLRLKPQSAKERDLFKHLLGVVTEIVVHSTTPDMPDALFFEIASAFRESFELDFNFQCLRLMVFAYDRQMSLLMKGNVLVHKAESYAAQALNNDVDVDQRRKMCACFCMATWFLPPHSQMRMIPHIDSLMREDALEEFISPFLGCLIHMIEVQRLHGASYPACFRLIDTNVLRDRCSKMNDGGQSMMYYALFTNKSPKGNRDPLREHSFEMFVME